MAPEAISQSSQRSIARNEALSSETGGNYEGNLSPRLMRSSCELNEILSLVTKEKQRAYRSSV